MNGVDSAEHAPRLRETPPPLRPSPSPSRHLLASLASPLAPWRSSPSPSHAAQQAAAADGSPSLAMLARSRGHRLRPHGCLRRDSRTPWKIPQIRWVNPHRGGPCLLTERWWRPPGRRRRPPTRHRDISRGAPRSPSSSKVAGPLPPVCAAGERPAGVSPEVGRSGGVGEQVGRWERGGESDPGAGPTDRTGLPIEQLRQELHPQRLPLDVPVRVVPRRARGRRAREALAIPWEAPARSREARSSPFEAPAVAF